MDCTQKNSDLDLKNVGQVGSWLRNGIAVNVKKRLFVSKAVQKTLTAVTTTSREVIANSRDWPFSRFGYSRHMRWATARTDYRNKVACRRVSARQLARLVFRRYSCQRLTKHFLKLQTRTAFITRSLVPHKMKWIYHNLFYNTPTRLQRDPH